APYRLREHTRVHLQAYRMQLCLILAFRIFPLVDYKLFFISLWCDKDIWLPDISLDRIIGRGKNRAGKKEKKTHIAA
ncbi:MAG: hypothetical protein WA144_12265, partial [Candidatus Methanoperedens sp.]